MLDGVKKVGLALDSKIQVFAKEGIALRAQTMAVAVEDYKEDINICGQSYIRRSLLCKFGPMWDEFGRNRPKVGRRRPHKHNVGRSRPNSERGRPK